MGQNVLNFGGATDPRAPKAPKPKPKMLSGTIVHIDTHGRRNFSISLQTDAGKKQILLHEAYLPGDEAGLCIGQAREFNCRANVGSLCSVAAWRATAVPSDIIPLDRTKGLSYG